MTRDKSLLTEDLTAKRKVIQKKGLNKIEEYFDMSMEVLGGIKPEILKHLYNMARIGMKFESEMNVSKRATEMNFIRIANMVTENKNEMKRYLKETMPEYVKIKK